MPADRVRLTGLVAAAGLDVVIDGGDSPIAAVAFDSRRVGPGDLFCCLRGAHADGHDHAASAVEAGAAALLVDHALDLAVPQIVHHDTRWAMGRLASARHGHPSRRLVVVGVTGTNGKTTTTSMVAAVCRAAGRAAEVIGTLSGSRTTPESPELQSALAASVERGTDVVAMEVSSHALAQHRVSGTWFTAVGFTNLSPDHLDFHRDMDDYFAAKARLFTPEFTGHAVVHVGDPWGRRLADEASVAVTTVGPTDAVALELAASGSVFGWRGYEVRLPIAGRYNVDNALVAAALCADVGIDDATIAAGFEAVDQIPGRFQLIDAGQPFRVVVDYAHTPDGLAGVLGAAREVAGGGRIIVVFGCGGDRDRSKRPLMGEIASRLADVVVVTSDNPRTEDPAAIVDSIVAGATRPVELVELDREAAIAAAIDRARPGDTVVIAGKGHETTQIIGDQVLAFDDAEVATRLIGELDR